MTYRKFIKLFICLAFILPGLNTNAQVAILQNTIDKLESYSNFSYQSIDKVKEYYNNDTITEQRHAAFKKCPAIKK